MPDYNYNGVDDYTGVWKGIGKGNRREDKSSLDYSNRFTEPSAVCKENAKIVADQIFALAESYGFKSNIPNSYSFDIYGNAVVNLQYTKELEYTTGILFRKIHKYTETIALGLVRFNFTENNELNIIEIFKFEGIKKLNKEELDLYNLFIDSVMSLTTHCMLESSNSFSPM